MCSKKPPTAKVCCELQRSGCEPRAVRSASADRLVLHGSSSDNRCVCAGALLACRMSCFFYGVRWGITCYNRCVCWFTACLQNFLLFLYGVSTGNRLLLPAGSQTSPERAFYPGWQPCDTYRNQLRLQSTLVGFRQELRYISTSV